MEVKHDLEFSEIYYDHFPSKYAYGSSCRCMRNGNQALIEAATATLNSMSSDLPLRHMVKFSLRFSIFMTFLTFLGQSGSFYVVITEQQSVRYHPLSPAAASAI